MGLLCWLAPTAATAAAALRLHQLSLDLPAAPAAVVSTDLDGDGVRDLAVLLVYTRWEQKMTTEKAEMDAVQGYVEVMTIVPALLDHRELWLLHGDGNGGYARRGEPLPIPVSVHSLSPGRDGRRLFALTDDGLGEVTWNAEGSGHLALVERLRQRSVLAGSGVFVADLQLFAEATGDGQPDLLLPARDALLVYPGEADGFATEPVARVPLPAADELEGPELELRYPLPEVRDVTGDRRADLIWRDPREGWGRPWVAAGLGGGRFADPMAPLPEGTSVPWSGSSPMFFGDLDGDGRAEVVVQHEHELPEDAGMRAEIRDAESPRSTLRLYPTAAGLAPAAQPTQTFDIAGHAFEAGSSEFELASGLQDLDGDGRQDLVTIELHISITRLLGGLALGRVSLPMNFRVWCQSTTGAFKEVRGLDLSGNLRVDLHSMKLRNLPSFAGDFDGDGRIDFVQLGRGRDVTIHTGRPGCAFPSSPDLTVKLRQEPQHLGLVRVRDLDGDGRADLMMVQPGRAPEAGVTPPARLDLYLSAGVRQ